MARLLITSFNNSPGNPHPANMGEAAQFKKHGLASGLILRERADELWSSLPPDLLEVPVRNQWGIRQVVYPDGMRMLGFIGLSAGQGPGWARVAKLPGDAFRAWLLRYFAEPVGCWVIGGHHHLNDAYDAMCWGTDWKRKVPGGHLYRPYAGFGVDSTTRELEWFGYPQEKDVPRQIVLPGAAAGLASVSLIMVLGCNGVPRMEGTEVGRTYSRAWRELVSGGAADRRPLVLGWFGVHGLPIDSLKRTASDKFWAEMKTISLGADLKTLCHFHTLKVIEAWGKACHAAFAGQRYQSDLWLGKDRGGQAIGAGAWAPDSAIYHANPEYPKVGEPAMKRVASA